jgi:hypothetical protein
MKRKNSPILVFMHMSIQAYALWNILLMNDHRKQIAAFRRFVTQNPVKGWDFFTIRAAVKYADTKNVAMFEGRMEKLNRLFNELSLDGQRTLIEKIRGYERATFSKRPHDSGGRILFGEHDRARILGDMLEGTQERFRPLHSAA